ncbi:hypothetical protein ABMA57_10310 [Saccharospirillum sp. HFRX-1]|uniref:hypothetical protein n=1 Tax=unclassified Saccharospirillum TaxID=2633430 RepID=UPI00371144FF
MKLFFRCTPLVVVLAGCQSFALNPSTASVDGATEQCIAPTQVPELEDNQNARQGWLNIQLELASGPQMQQWRALQHYDVTEPASAELIAALVTSRADMPEALRRLGQQTLQRQQPYLPASVQPVFDQTLQFNDALLERDLSRRQRQASERRMLQLEADLAEKERQIEALTAIESQLRQEELSAPRAPDAGDADDR